MRIYRIEHKERNSGMWYSEDAVLHDYFNTNIPMKADRAFRTLNKVWYTGVLSLNDLRKWFSKKFIQKMLNNGYSILELEVDEVILQPNQVLFTKENAVVLKELSLDEVYPE